MARQTRCVPDAGEYHRMTLLIPARGAVDSPPMTEYVAANRSAWDRWSDGYQAKHGWLLASEHAEAWGLWRIPERELQVLGDVSGRDVLEVGCGAANWSIALARRGARVVALDNSPRQLEHARRAAEPSLPLQLVEGTAEALPFDAARFDVVFSDYGALSWVDPAVAVPEVARVLRTGGLLAFCTTSPFFFLFLDSARRELRHELQRDYFGMRTRDVGDGATDFQVPFGEWIAIFRRAGLCVEDLIEVQPPADAITTFRDRPLEWARRWPVENIWRVRRLPEADVARAG